MGKFFAPNISGWGRLVRALWGFGCLGGAILLYSRSRWAAGILTVAALFAFYEAVRGWCIVRACGIKTKV